MTLQGLDETALLYPTLLALRAHYNPARGGRTSLIFFR